MRIILVVFAVLHLVAAFFAMPQGVVVVGACISGALLCGTFAVLIDRLDKVPELLKSAEQIRRLLCDILEKLPEKPAPPPAPKS